MKNLVRFSLSVCALLLFSCAVMGQSRQPAKHDRNVRSGGSNPAIVIVSSAAKGTWAVTAFTAKTVAKPLAKTVLLKVTPAVSKFVLKNAAKQAIPLMVRLSVL